MDACRKEIGQAAANIILSRLNGSFSQKEKINQFNIDTQELEFLKLNLEHGHKCRKSFFNTDGFNVGTEEYKSCVLNGGRTGG